MEPELEAAGAVVEAEVAGGGVGLEAAGAVALAGLSAMVVKGVTRKDRDAMPRDRKQSRTGGRRT